MSVNYVKKSVFLSMRFGIYFGEFSKDSFEKVKFVNKLIKNELPHNRLLRILRASIYGILHVSFYGTQTFSLLVLALVKCTSCFSYP